MRDYTEEFFAGIRGGSRRSAGVIVPLVVGMLRPRSVVDVGCGDGTWLSVFKEHGVAEVLGVDGDYARPSLRVAEREFLAADLRRPLRLARGFDLAVSLEVAEHLPAGCAETFVESLTSLAPFVLFSAAVPFQGGTEHLNEQWPEYWAGLFARGGYVALDCVRGEVWRDDAVEWWYAQNTLLFARRDVVGSSPALGRAARRTKARGLSAIHPRSCVLSGRRLRDLPRLRLGAVLRVLPSKAMNAMRRKLARA